MVMEQIIKGTTMRYYVSWLQDCGFGAGMHCHSVVEAPNWEEAFSRYEDLAREAGKREGNSYAVFGIGTPVACFLLEDQEEPSSQVLDRFRADTLEDQYTDPRTPLPVIKLGWWKSWLTKIKGN